MPHPANVWSIAEARDHALAHGAHGVVDTFLERLLSRSRSGVWISIAAEGTLRARADELDAVAARRGARALHGVPFAVKDNIDVAGVPTTAGSREFSYTPELSAPAVTRLIEAGAIFVGKTNLDQFATRLSGTCSPEFGICGNPDDPDYIVGGSSSGSAVAVALGLAPIALGTDTAGSGRVPAACCGVVGLKPTRERVRNTGLVPASPSFDTVSVFATSSADAATTFAVLVEPDRARHERGVPLRWRIGVPPTLAWFGDDDARRRYDAAIARLDRLGAELHDVDISPFLEAGALLYGSALVAQRYGSFGDFVLRSPDETGATDAAGAHDRDRPPRQRRAQRVQGAAGAGATALVDGRSVESRRRARRADDRASPDDQRSSRSPAGDQPRPRHVHELREPARPRGDRGAGRHPRFGAALRGVADRARVLRSGTVVAGVDVPR